MTPEASHSAAAVGEAPGEIAAEAAVQHLGYHPAPYVMPPHLETVFTTPAGRRRRVPPAPVVEPPPAVTLKLDGRDVTVPAGSTILDACRAEGIDVPTMCFLDNLTPVNV